jgi:hypothetical protein
MPDRGHEQFIIGCPVDQADDASWLMGSGVKAGQQGKVAIFGGLEQLLEPLLVMCR